MQALGLFYGGKTGKIEKKFNPGADLRSVVCKLMRGITVVTPAIRDVVIMFVPTWRMSNHGNLTAAREHLLPQNQ